MINQWWVQHPEFNSGISYLSFSNNSVAELPSAIAEGIAAALNNPEGSAEYKRARDAYNEVEK